MDFAHLLRRFPRAKVILTVRESAEVWYESLRSMYAYWNSTRRTRSAELQRFWLAVHAASGCHPSDPRTGVLTLRDQCLARYHDHIRRVQAIVPPGQLLVFNAQHGWA